MAARRALSLSVSLTKTLQPPAQTHLPASSSSCLYSHRNPALGALVLASLPPCPSAHCHPPPRQPLRLPLASRAPGDAARSPRAPSLPGAPGHALCGAAALPHPFPRQSYAKYVRSPRGPAAGHGEPPPPPPPRAPLSPERGSDRSPRRGRARFLRCRGWRTP